MSNISKREKPVTVPPSSNQSEIGGDSTVAALYKVRHVHRSRSKTRRSYLCCSFNDHQAAKCWAFTNLVFCVLDLVFSMCEIIVFTLYSNHSVANSGVELLEKGRLWWAFFLVSIVMHGDCYESLIEIILTFSAELVYVLSSLIFAFATVLDREDYKVSRCLTKWFTFTVWIPPLALIPRFVLNVVSTCNRSFSAKLFPNSNENIPKILFWIVNLLHVFFMLMWLLNGRVVALKFLSFKRDEEQKFLNQSRLFNVSGDGLSSAQSASVIISRGGAVDRALRNSALGGILPPPVSMV